MRKVDKATYWVNPNRYELRRGATVGAPLCPFGNHYEWIGFDLELEEYVRFTKSVFKILVAEKNQMV